jgi:TP901 family phage tail tape measure protein
MAMMGGGATGLRKWGSQVQWAGRQLQYNFTLPLAIAGGAAVKFALDNEKAMVRVIKVYGDGTEATKGLAKTEIPALSKAFEALSERFGVAQADAINIAADWAAAGASGLALAKSVELTMKTMVLGEMDAAEATQALIAIQAQYGFGIDKLARTIDQLNMIENQTGISMQGLVQGFARAAGVARSAGIDTRHLGAMLAALVPAAGSAANAGNALKTIISRLLSPTKEAAEVMALMGVNTADMAWKSLNGAQRLELMSKKFIGLSDAQKAVVSSVMASRYQINRFDVLMRDIANTHGYYQKALKATVSDQRNFNQQVYELNTVLNSNPQRLKQMWTILQNAMADVIQPMIPYIIIAAKEVAGLAKSFANIDPNIQKFILAGLAALAILGLVARYVGATATLFALLGGALADIGKSLLWFGGILKAALITPLVSAASAMWTAIAFMVTGAGKAITKGIPFLWTQGLALGTAIKTGFVAGMTALPGLLVRIALGATSAILAVMPVATAVGAALGAALSTASAYVYVFFSVQVPAAIAAARAFIWLASTKVALVMAAAVTASGPALIAAVGFVWEVATAAIYRAGAALYAATVAIVAPMAAGISRFFIMLPAMVAFGLRNLPIVVGAAAVRAAGVFIAAIKGIPAAAKAVWVATVATTKFLMAMGPAIIAALASPWTYVIVAVGAAIGFLWKHLEDVKRIFRGILDAASVVLQPLVDAWNGAVKLISDAFWKLPASIRNVLITIVTMISNAAKAVYEWFSYLNPFAHHSPSLVEQVTAGMAVIRKQYASVGNVGAVFKKAASDLAAYKSAISGLGGGQFADEIATLAKSLPSALPLFKALVGDLAELNRILSIQEQMVSKQQSAVDAWKAKLDAANSTLDVQKNKLDNLQDALSKLNDEYAAHQQAVSDYASAPLKGMGQMEDAIFANDMAQKKLRLEMMKWEQANGSIEDVKNKMASLAGSIEQLRGEAADLQKAGAGSDVLGPIADQIAQMEAAYKGMDQAAQNSPISDMQKQLEELQRQGEMLDLEKSINFDPLTREVDKLANAQKELGFDEVVAGITREQAAMAALQPQIDAATAAVAKQQAAVDAATAARDAISARYDVESGKLQILQDEYNKTKDAIQQVEGAMRGLSDAAQSNASAMEKAGKSGRDHIMSPGAQNFIDSAGGNFPEVGGIAQIGRESVKGAGLGDQSKQIEEFTKGIQDDIKKSFGGLDMFGPIKKKWNEFTGWWGTNVTPIFSKLGEGLGQTWTKITDWFNKSGIQENASKGWDKVTSAISTLWEWGQKLWDLFGGDLTKIWGDIKAAFSDAWNEIGPELAQFSDVWPGLQKVLGAVGTIIKWVAMIIGAVLVGALKIVTALLAHVLKPAFELIIGVIKNVIRIVRGFVELIVGIFTLDLDMMVKGVTDIFGGLVDGIWSVLKNGWNLIWGLVEGFVNGFIGWIQWLYDVIVGHSIIPDMVKAIIEWIASLPGKAWEALKTFVSNIVKVAQDSWDGFTAASEKAWNTVIAWIKGLGKSAWDNMKDLVTKLGNGASEAWTSFKNAASKKWNEIIAWVKTLGANAWNNFKDLVTKLAAGASAAWQAFRDAAGTKWNAIIAWIKLLPQNAYNGLLLIVTKLRDLAAAAFNALFQKAKDIVDGKSGMMSWIANIPGRIAKALGGIGGAIANAVKASWNGAAGWLNDNAIGAVNKVTSKFGFNLSALPKFAGGGVIPGRVSKKDNTIIAARTGEGVIVPELVRKLGGARGLAMANQAAKTGNQGALERMGIGGYKDGGIIGKVTGWLQSGVGSALSNIIGATKAPVRSVIPGRPFAEDWMVGGLQGWQDAAKKWGDKKESMGDAVLPVEGYKAMIAAVKGKFPDAVITSSYRPGAITALGNKSMHGMGRAIDIAPRMDIFNWLASTYGKHTQELFYSPADGRTILRGKPWHMDPVTKADHWDHIHWGYDKGGILPPGHTLAYNGTGKNEVTLTADQWGTFSSVVGLVDAMSQKRATGTTPGSAMTTRIGATLATVEARLRNAETRSSQVTRTDGRGGDTFNFYGDLSFPNIQDGSDLEDFVNELRGLG